METLYITDTHSTTSKKSDFLTARNCLLLAGDLRSLAADKGYDKKVFREELRGAGTRTLIKYRQFTSLDYSSQRLHGQR